MIRIATIGTSMITRNFLQVLGEREDARFVGTLSRDAERAAAFTPEHGGTCPFTELKRLAASPDVDAVYIASPNALHREQAIACIEGGKHVLVEKPFAANEREAREVFAAAARAGVVAMEAMRPLHDPAFHQCVDALGALGRIRRATLRFGKYSSRYDEILAGRHTNIFDAAMASGALMDIGVYCVEPLIALFGEPSSISCAPVLLDPETRELAHGPIDGAGVILARYEDMVASVHYSKITTDLSPNQIEGERGTLTLDAVSAPQHARIDLRGEAHRTAAAKDGYSSTKTLCTEINIPACDNTMCHELADFIAAVEAVRTGEDPDKAPAGPFGTIGRFRNVTLRSLALMDEARHQAGIVFPTDAVRA